MLHNYGFFVVVIVYCGIHAGGISTHSCVIGLHEESAPEGEDVELHETYKAVQD